MELEQYEKKIILPRFKDKVMYVPASQSSTKVDTSYVISSSFKGIVRLSPNNHNSTYERPTYQLSLTDENNLGTTYSDAILFDNEVETAIKSEADITKRMIIGSDSDGYTIGFRVSKNNFEFDNLGVIGVTEANHLSIISSATTSNEDVLLLNNDRMPHIPNRVQEAINIKTYSDVELKEEVTPQSYNEKEVKITDGGDKSFLLLSLLTGQGEKFNKYQRTSYLIREMIMEALMDFQTIPTGSIHWFPVTIEQFRNLVADNGGKPNVSFTSHEQNETTDPLLRDFLLCDGRRYNNKDFPELAKILWKEPIRRWRKVQNSGTDYMLPFWDTKCNEYGIKDTKKNPDGSDQEDASGKKLYEHDYTFRVPDLRHQFISSTYIDGTVNVTSGAAGSGITDRKSVTGGWCPDKTPPSSVEFRTDRHAHFVAYGSYGKKYHSSVKSISGDNKLWTSCSIQADIPFERDTKVLHKMPNEDTAYVTLLHNHPYKKHVVNDDFRGFGWRYNTPSDRKHSGIDSIPATMWLSRPDISNTTNLGENGSAFSEWRQNGVVLGQSSPDVTAAIKPSKYADIDETFVGNSKWGETYEPWGNYQNSLYGHESTPKYYAMLPFIKI